jgi:hypothetical protein
VYAFDVTYSEVEAATAARAFMRRSIRELRGSFNFAVLVVLPLLLAAALAFSAPSWVVFALLAFLIASITGEVFFYLARPAEAKRLARKFPIRHFELGRKGVEMTVGGKSGLLPWTRIRHVWTTGDAVLLVLSAYSVLTIPLRQLPEGAYDYMLAASKSPPNKSLERTREG